MTDIAQLVNWLGPDGAIAGLEKSDLTISELRELGDASKGADLSKLKRGELIRELVKRVGGRISISVDELMQMDSVSLQAYFQKVKASRSEIIELLLSLDIRPGNAARSNLFEFAAQEISDIGMYKRIAKGTQRKE